MLFLPYLIIMPYASDSLMLSFPQRLAGAKDDTKALAMAMLISRLSGSVAGGVAAAAAFIANSNQ